MDKCPSCEREFKYWNDYPLIYIKRFEREPIPEFIGFQNSDIRPEKKLKGVGNMPVPKDIPKLFKESGTDCLVYKGNIYRKSGFDMGVQWYDIARDATSITNTAINSIEVQNTLSRIERFAGQLIKSKDLDNLVSNVKIVGSNFNLSFSGHQEEIADYFHLILTSDWHGGGSFSSPDIAQPLGAIFYEGRINNS